MKAPVATVAACLVVVAAMVALTLIERKRHDSEMDDLRRRVAALGVAIPERGEGKPEQHGSYQPAIMPPPLLSPMAPQSQLPPPTESSKPAFTAAEMRDGYEIMFGSDHADPAWTGAEMRQVRNKIVAALPDGSELRSLDCRALMCRIETSHVDMPHYHTFVRAAFMNPETQIWNSGTMSTPLRDDTSPGEPLIMVSYVGREGHDLPPPR